MRATTVNTICTLALSSILTIGFEAAAQDMKLEAQAGCSVAECAFEGNSQTRDAIATLQRLPVGNGEARLMKVNRYSDNPDQVVNRAVETQFAPIGELESVRSVKDSNGNDSHVYGTGFMVSPCYALTNHHVVFGDDMKPVAGKDYSMKFRAGVSQSTAFAGNTVATPVLWGDREESGRNDWALVKLNSCIGKRADIGWYDAGNKGDGQLRSAQVGVAGFAGDRERGQLSLGIGKVTGLDVSNGMLKYSASMAPGQSGGAVFAMDQGKMVLVGLNTWALSTSKNSGDFKVSTYSDDRANEFQNVSTILGRPEVKALLDADKASFGQPSPVAQLMTRPLAGTRAQTASL